MQTLIDRLDAWNARLARALGWIGGLALVAMMALSCANIVLRAVWVPVPGAYELIGFAGAVLAAFSLSYTQLHKTHISVGILAGRLPRLLRRTCALAATLASSLLFCVAAEETFGWGLYLERTGELSETLILPYHPVVFAVALGCLLLGFSMFTDFLKILSGKVKV